MDYFGAISTRILCLAILAHTLAASDRSFAESPIVLPGACCLSDSRCAQLTASECELEGGEFDGPAIDCADASCTRATAACDDARRLIRCPETLIFETDGPNGMLVELLPLPDADGCDLVFAYDPPAETAFPVGVTPVAVLAYDPDGVVVDWICGFDVVVDLVAPPTQPQRKGDGAGTPGIGCNPFAFIADDPAPCGPCQAPLGLLVVPLLASRHRRRPR